MKKIVFFIALFTLVVQLLHAQNMFTKEMGPAMNMDNSIASILMDLSTENKEYLMKGEKFKLDTLDRYYPNKLFGANIVYIKADYDPNSYKSDSYDATTKGQIIASFTSTGSNMMEALQSITTNIEGSKLWQRFFKKDETNKDLNIIMYVQKTAFELPPNPRFTPAQLAEINNGLKANFEKYKIKMGVETMTVEYNGGNYEYLRVRSWVQLNEKETAKKITARNTAYDKDVKAKADFEKREMQGVKNTEANIVKPNSPGKSIEVDKEALIYFLKRQDSLYNNYNRVIDKYKQYSSAEQVKNKQISLREAKEAFLAYKTNKIHFETYLQSAIFKQINNADDKKIAQEEKEKWSFKGDQYFAFDYVGFSEIIKVFELK